jgi:TatD DNase family protein
MKDSPWCSMTSTHASRKHIDSLPADLRESFLPPAVRAEAFVPGRPVKGRNEPSAIGGVAWVAHKVKGDSEVPFEEFVEQGWRNTVELFGLRELASDGVAGL